ncbi:P-loop containing nucleoside triphosphate hydrolase protein [Stemphylium lycopersici]|uniref:P-loop containing nucleoside triphosphate hydrolase protein n=1 Tax=Stemphylium lycopersici TaxID=183478 RepID=A0A364N006_STELY|nr:P-loop containing nucleoside triphosphate hydrolase protein [Stemphylium lycopersici]
MTSKPIFVATHPRACSTAFERVFMTRHDTLQCVHEPFGDAYYFGPERLAERYENDPKARKESGYEESTYRTIFDRIARENSEGKRAFIKDMAQYWIPPNGKPATIAPSLSNYRSTVGTNTTELSPVTTRSERPGPPYPYDTQGEPNNPTVIPAALLATYHFTFLIRHPKYSIPSYYRCTIPPLDAMTGFYNFRPDEAGYDELRRLFDYLRSEGQIGPKFAGSAQETEANGHQTNGHQTNGHQTNGNHTNGDHTNGNQTNGHTGGVEICVIDADDLLDNPSAMIEAYCKTTGIEWDPDMLVWDTEKDQGLAKEAFEKWKGFHEDALDSDRLRQRTHKKEAKSDDQLFAEWKDKYGEEGAKVIRDTVAANVDTYEYLKQFAIKV